MKKFIIIIFILLFAPKDVFAYQCGSRKVLVSGIVFDQVLQNPLSDVQVQLQLNSVKLGEVILTSDNGVFEIFTEFAEPKGKGYKCKYKIKKVTLTVSQTGYETVVIERKVKNKEYHETSYNLNFRFMNYLFNMGKIELKKIK